jgi:broad specificity phosphatase PhoE
MAKKQTGQIAFRYRGTDSSAGVTRQTAKRMAKALGVDETQVIHLALREMAVRVLPQYEPDDGPLTEAQVKQVQKAAGSVSRGPVRSSLIDADLK